MSTQKVVVIPETEKKRSYEFLIPICYGQGGTFRRYLSADDLVSNLHPLGGGGKALVRGLVGEGPSDEGIQGITDVVISPLRLTVVRSLAAPSWYELDQAIFQLLTRIYKWEIESYLEIINIELGGISTIVEYNLNIGAS